MESKRIAADSNGLASALERAFYPSHYGVYDYLVYHDTFTIFAPRAPIMAFHAKVSAPDADFSGTLSHETVLKLMQILKLIKTQSVFLVFDSSVTLGITV